jgi:osmotically-inducible protein OsmY
MMKFRQDRMSLSVGIGILALLLSSACAGDGYHAVDAANSGLSSLTVADDYRHQRRLQQTLLEDTRFAGLRLTAYVIMDHGYIVGHVQSPEQAEAVFQAAKKVEGLRSVNAFLPLKRTVDGIGKVTSDAALKEHVQAALAQAPGVVDARVQVEVLDGRAVLLGVVSDVDEKSRAEGAAAATAGVKRVISWLLLPETEYLAIRSQVF